MRLSRAFNGILAVARNFFYYKFYRKNCLTTIVENVVKLIFCLG